jgi:hypothetical protein
MSAGTAIIAIALVFLAIRSEAFRMFCFAMLGICIGLVAFLVDFGSDKPQTIFYSSSAHPAFLMHVGDTCPQDRHVWNGWCVK